jgi:cyanate lyase
MTRDEITARIVAARLASGLSWQQLSDAIAKPLVWTTAALLGQHPLSPADAATIAALLELPDESVAVLTAAPMRGGGVAAIPTDPTIYRFHEALLVYGPALKELIHEQFGDGIMSAINFSLTIDKQPHPSGDRVVVTFDGKFLPYDWTSAD